MDQVDDYLLTYPIVTVYDTAMMADETLDQFSAFPQLETDVVDPDTPCPAVFTDDDLANRFARHFGLAACGKMALPSRDIFLAFLANAEKHGATHFGVDVIRPGTGRIISIARFRAANP